MNENIAKDRWDDLVLRAQENIDLPMATFEVEVYAILYAASEIKRLNRDIEAYRGALGYTVEAGHDGRLSTGVLPFCGLCDAKAEQIRQLEQSNQWVKISDRKPAECESVLACNFHLSEIEVDQTYLSDESWVIADGIALSFDTYTHWMPIPKPPVSY